MSRYGQVTNPQCLRAANGISRYAHAMARPVRCPPFQASRRVSAPETVELEVGWHTLRNHFRHRSAPISVHSSAGRRADPPCQLARGRRVVPVRRAIA
jgi:hypothetical protein